MAELKTLNDLFIQRLKYVYDAEQRLTKALPQLSKPRKDCSARTAMFQ